MTIRCTLSATFEIVGNSPTDHKDAFECIEDACDKLRELGSCDVVTLEVDAPTPRE